jgi:hypothetical protein
MRGKGDVHEARVWIGESEGMEEKGRGRGGGRRRRDEEEEEERQEREKGEGERSQLKGGRSDRGGKARECAA